MNATTFRYAIFFVGATLLLCVCGIIGLTAFGHAVPDVLQNIATGSLTGLIGLLVTPHTGAK